ncbi:hypothetical protein DSO57_1037040 [Entomophthora muscae]|uniref:Uncharacterized protein n=1 Tax=Entomophthora muscae TaxID=34485 RepID=A0ACC2TM74_9FUNG|nr:hypothetical protein DSO57_1037040 [Entomophthora muscae]
MNDIKEKSNYPILTEKKMAGSKSGQGYLDLYPAVVEQIGDSSKDHIIALLQKKTNQDQPEQEEPKSTDQEYDNQSNQVAVKSYTTPTDKGSKSESTQEISEEASGSAPKDETYKEPQTSSSAPADK